jgi:hypothetical protein
MRLVERDDTSVILFDFDDATGLNNPLGLVTTLTDQDLGAYEAPLDIVKAKGSGQATRVLSDPQVRMVSLEVSCVAPDGKMSTLISAIDRLYNLLTSEAAPDRLIAFNDGSGIRYIEPLGIENAMPNLRGRDSTILQATAEGIEAGLVFEISCLPALVSTEIKSDDNVVTNAMMAQRDDNATGDPAFWAWASTTNIAARSIDAAVGAYTFTIATTSARNLQQTTAVGTATAGQTYTDSFYLKAAVAGIVRAQAVIRFLDAAGSVLGTETVGVLTDIGTLWTRLGVSAVAPASTSRILVTLRFQNAAATTVQVWTRDAQAEPGSSMTTFRTGNDVVSADAADEFGLVFPLVVGGTAPTPVVFDIQPLGANSKVVSMRYAARWNHGVDGEQRILDYLNETHWIPGGATDARTAWTITLENMQTASGAGAATDTQAFNDNGLVIAVTDANLGVRLRRWRAVRTTNLDSLRGEWMVYGRFCPQESDTEWLAQLQWGLKNTEPMPRVLSPHSFSVESTTESLRTDLTTYSYIPLGIMRIPREGSLGALRLELWVTRKNDVTIGAGHLKFGGMFLMPFAPRSNIYVPGSEKIDWDENEFSTPAVRIASDPSGYWNAGEKLAGGGIRLNQPGESMGVKPNTGQGYGTGRVWISFDVARADDPNPNSPIDVPTGYRVRIIRTSDGSVISRKMVRKAKKYVIQFDAVDGETYQPQAIHVGNGGDRFSIAQISKRVLPYVGQNERLVSDPEFFTRTKQDSVGNIQTHLEVQGQTPFVLEPGRYVIAIMPGEARQLNHDEDDAPINRTFNVRTRYSPRWTQ